MEVAVALAAAGAFIVKVIDLIRRLYPRLDGVGVQVAATLIGVGLAFGTGLQGVHVLWSMAASWASAGDLPPLVVSLPPVVDMLVTGVVLGLASGYLSDLRPTSDPRVVVVNEQPAQGHL